MTVVHTREKDTDPVQNMAQEKKKQKTTESAWTVKSCQCHHYVELDTTLMIDWF